MTNPATSISGAMRHRSSQTNGSPMLRSRAAHWPALDQALLQSIANGSEHAMRMLFARHNVSVYRFLIRLGVDTTIAEDLVSEVFFAAWRQAGRYQGRSQVSTWLLAIARNKAISIQRRRPPEQLDGTLEFMPDPRPDPEAAMQLTERSELLLRCLNQLSHDHREIIDLVYYHGRSVLEVAEIIGISQNTARTRMYYARKRLATLLSEAGAQ